MSKQEAILSKLKETAAARATVYYQELGDLIGLNMSSLKERERLSDILGKINIAEDAEGRPMISAVAVLKESSQYDAAMRPGVGFFNIAHNPLGRYSGSRDRDEQEAFWIAEINRVYAYWSKASAS